MVVMPVPLKAPTLDNISRGRLVCEASALELDAEVALGADVVEARG